MSFTRRFLGDAQKIIDMLDISAIDRAVDLLVELRERQGRLFILGVGGSAANASHAVNDFRKITGIESYAPTDNVSELTARTNDEGWSTIFSEWLKVSRLSANDALLILSVGGGSLGEKREPQSGSRITVCKNQRRKNSRHCFPRWRLHGTGSGCLRLNTHR